MFLVATAMDKIVQHPVVGDILARIDSTNDVMGYNYMTARYLICVREAENFDKPRLFGPWKFTDGVRSWTFNEHDGDMVTVEVFSNGDFVELFLNGTSLGRKRNGEKEGCYTSFDLPYTCGELKAVSYLNDVIIGADILRTSDGTLCIDLSTEDYRNLPNSADIVFVNISLVDEFGERAVLAKNICHSW